MQLQSSAAVAKKQKECKGSERRQGGKKTGDRCGSRQPEPGPYVHSPQYNHTILPSRSTQIFFEFLLVRDISGSAMTVLATVLAFLW